jgi:hypothetical protein
MMYIYRIKSDFLRNKTQVVTGILMTLRCGTRQAVLLGCLALLLGLQSGALTLNRKVAGNNLTDSRNPVADGADHPSDSPGWPLITRLRYRFSHDHMFSPGCCTQRNY